jgi:hypothetical protein
VVVGLTSMSPSAAAVRTAFFAVSRLVLDTSPMTSLITGQVP